MRGRARRPIFYKEKTMPKTKIVTTMKKNSAAKKKKSFHKMGKKTHRTKSGYSMKGILKGQMTYKSRKK
jgi:hypothetical protein